jgi:gamma-glutamylcyclotransferase (GGCT)/AIG2-like uncharacterized protein YtfP
VGDKPALLMFFYGTLKRGHRNHAAFCRGARFVGEATLRGRLYDLPYGYPALTVAPEDVLAVGTANPAGDASTQHHHGSVEVRRTDGPRVFGELYAFDDPEARLPAIDRLEGFDPVDGSGPYRRVLSPVQTTSNEGVLAWAYVVAVASGIYLPEGRWPA